jgi:hypothetical protein
VRRAKNRMITVSTDVDIYLDEIDTDDLIAELKARGRDSDVQKIIDAGDHTAAMERALEAMDRGDRLTAMDELRNALHPHDVAKAYQAAREGNHPFLTVRPQ